MKCRLERHKAHRQVLPRCGARRQRRTFGAGRTVVALAPQPCVIRALSLARTLGRPS